MKNVFELSLKLDNAAFHPEPNLEVSRILRDVASKVDLGHTGGPIFDVNGNNVGQFYLDFESDEEEDEENG